MNYQIKRELQDEILAAFQFTRKAYEWREAKENRTTASSEFLLDELETYEMPLWLGAPTESSNFYDNKATTFLLVCSDGPNKAEYLVRTEGYDYARYIARIVRK